MQGKNFRNFIYLLKVQRVCLLGQRWLNSNVTCLNTIQSAKVCKNCGNWYCLKHWFVKTLWWKLKTNNKVLCFTTWFYIIMQTEWSSHMWDLNSVIFVQEDRLFGLSVGKWSSWNFFFAFYMILIKSEGLGPLSTLIWRGRHGLVYTNPSDLKWWTLASFLQNNLLSDSLQTLKAATNPTRML